MIHIIKNYKWIIATSLICIIFGLLTFFTFINQSFIILNDLNLQILLISDQYCHMLSRHACKRKCLHNLCFIIMSRFTLRSWIPQVIHLAYAVLRNHLFNRCQSNILLIGEVPISYIFLCLVLYIAYHRLYYCYGEEAD